MCRAGEVLKGVLPKCPTVPKNGYPHSVTRYAGYLEIKDSSTYPDDHTLYRHNEETSAGNPIVDQKVCGVERIGWYQLVVRADKGEELSIS